MTRPPRSIVETERKGLRPSTEDDLALLLVPQRNAENAPWLHRSPDDARRAAVVDPGRAHRMVQTIGSEKVVGCLILAALQSPTAASRPSESSLGARARVRDASVCARKKAHGMRLAGRAATLARRHES